MKKLVTAALAAVLLMPFLQSCSEKNTPEAQTPAVQAKNFTFVERVPLKEAREGVGEGEILDPGKLTSQNIAMLQPTFQKIAGDVLTGKYEGYPIMEEDPDQDPKTFIQRFIDSKRKKGLDISPKHISQCLEIASVGSALDGKSSKEVEWVYFIWMDVDGQFPDMNLFKIRLENFRNYEVQTASGTVSFVDYIKALNYERYAIRTEMDERGYGVRTYDESRQMTLMVEEGRIDEIPNLHAMNEAP